ncbi:MAG: glycosyltransferase family 9 protein, partial [Mariniphaga sp.]
YVDKVHLFSGNINELYSVLKAEQFDYIIDLHHNFRSNRIRHLLKIPSFAFQKLNIQKFLLVRFKINRLPDKHVVDRYMETVQVFDVKNDGKGLDYFISAEENYGIRNLPQQFVGGYIAFVIAGTYSTKKLPAHKVIEICNRIDFPVVLLGGKNEEQVGKEIYSQTGDHVLNLAGKLTLNQSASLVRDAKLVLSNDTGLMHIAAAYGKKILSFWGNTVPQFGMTPYKAHTASQIMEVKNLRCRPCSKLGYNSCPKGHFRCMEYQVTDKSIDWITRNLNAEE